MVWCDQLDIRNITATGQPGALSAGAVAGYVAKYATKAATDTFGASLDRPIRTADELDALPVRAHIGRLVRAAWDLGAHPDLRRLRRWAHQLGYGGHWSTRSRRYSTTFTRLRQARADHARQQAAQLGPGRAVPEQAAPVPVGTWTYAGARWASEAERWLALAAAARAREHRHLARAERASSAA